MAAKVFYYLTRAPVAPYWWSVLQEGGSAPKPATNTSYGYSISASPVGPYTPSWLGSTSTNGNSYTSSQIALPTGPKPGTDAIITGDSFVSPTPYSGTFDTGSWYLQFALQALMAGAHGHLNARIWASKNLDGSAARDLVGGRFGGAVTDMTTAGIYVVSVPVSAPQITLDNEYLFFQLEWQETTPVSSQVLIQFAVGSTSTLTTTNFSATPVGTLNVVQQPDRLVGFGFATTIYGSLGLTQQDQGLAAKGGPSAGATLGLTQDDQTVSARAYGPDEAALNVTQASQTLAGRASGGVVQDAQTLDAIGKVFIVGGLVRVQADQALDARAGPVVVGGLNRTQNDQTLTGRAGPIAKGTLTALQPDQTVTGAIRTRVDGSLSITQQGDAANLSGFVRPFVELAGDMPVVLPISGPPLTEWQDIIGGFSAFPALGPVDLNVRQMLPLIGDLKPSILFGSTGMTTTLSLDLPASGVSTTVNFPAAAMTVTPAVGLATTTLSVNVALAGVLDIDDVTSWVIIDCGTF